MILLLWILLLFLPFDAASSISIWISSKMLYKITFSYFCCCFFLQCHSNEHAHAIRHFLCLHCLLPRWSNHFSFLLWKISVRDRFINSLHYAAVIKRIEKEFIMKRIKRKKLLFLLCKVYSILIAVKFIQTNALLSQFFISCCCFVDSWSYLMQSNRLVYPLTF